jgi:sortase family protein
MPLRGSAQFLLHFFRSRLGLGWTVGTIGGAALAASAAMGAIPAPTELAQLAWQSVWTRVLTETPEHAPWPWATAPAEAKAMVPRLGLSAAMIDERASDRDGLTLGLAPETADGARDPAFSDLAVGDHITVTTAGGASRVYRVTGCKVVDPHLAEGAPRASGVDANLVTCMPFDSRLANSLRLTIQATTADPPAPRQEQKL